MVKYLHMFYYIEKESGLIYGTSYKLRVYNTIEYTTDAIVYKNPLFTQKFNTEAMATKAATTYIKERHEDKESTTKQEEIDINSKLREAEYKEYQNKNRNPVNPPQTEPVTPTAIKKMDPEEIYFTFKNQDEMDAKKKKVQ